MAVSETLATTDESASGNDTALAVSQEGLASCDVQPPVDALPRADITMAFGIVE